MSQAAPLSPECLMEPIPGVLSGGHRFWADFGVSPHAGCPAGTYDRRSWLVSAAELGGSRPIASVRLTSRSEGPLKIEEHFGLPHQLRGPRTAEIADFTMANRSPTEFAPLILGLFGVVTRVLARLDAIYAVACSPPELITVYEWLGVRPTGLMTRHPSSGSYLELLVGRMSGSTWVERGRAGSPLSGGIPEIRSPF
jgi:hypothetical protein